MQQQEFHDWLKGQTQETCVKIAARAALRVLPVAMAIDGTKDWQKQLALMPTPEVRAIARTALTSDAASYATANAARAAVAYADAAYADTQQICSPSLFGIRRGNRTG